MTICGRPQGFEGVIELGLEPNGIESPILMGESLSILGDRAPSFWEAGASAGCGERGPSELAPVTSGSCPLERRPLRALSSTGPTGAGSAAKVLPWWVTTMLPSSRSWTST